MMLGQDIHHATLGIVGFGRIGQALARRARAFSMLVLYHDMYLPPAEVEPRRITATWRIFRASPTSSPSTPTSACRRAI
jgi:lactate dehydrogenase-like 2-hydroxyacid dehydrogenase